VRPRQIALVVLAVVFLVVVGVVVTVLLFELGESGPKIVTVGLGA
jgi:hypothetical protein